MTVISLAATGHRPDKLGGWDNTAAFNRLVDLAVAYLNKFLTDHPDVTVRVISGMAQGWDMAWAVAGLRLRNQGQPVTVCAAVPFASQVEAWSKNPPVQRLWHRIVEAADERPILYPNPRNRGEAGKLLNDRNRWMVEQADRVVALWNGDHPSTNGKKSGTGNCVMDAREAQKPVTNLWASWVAHSGLA